MTASGPLTCGSPFLETHVYITPTVNHYIWGKLWKGPYSASALGVRKEGCISGYCEKIILNPKIFVRAGGIGVRPRCFKHDVATNFGRNQHGRDGARGIDGTRHHERSVGSKRGEGCRAESAWPSYCHIQKPGIPDSLSSLQHTVREAIKLKAKNYHREANHRGAFTRVVKVVRVVQASRLPLLPQRSALLPQRSALLPPRCAFFLPRAG